MRRKKVAQDLGERECPCGNMFAVPISNPDKVYCSRECALRLGMKNLTQEQWSEMIARRSAKRRERLSNELDPMTKREAYFTGWKSGYQSGRHRYHWKRFVRRLKALIDGVADD